MLGRVGDATAEAARCFARALIAVSSLAALLVGACDRAGDRATTETLSLVGDPIESVQQVEGVAPAPISLTFSPPDSESIDSASFTIGLFEEDPQCAHFTRAQQIIPTCSISADLNPAFGGVTTEYLTAVLPTFDDTSVVEVTVNVGGAQAMHWDWTYKARYQQPYNLFWADVVDQNGQTTNVIPPTSAPDNWGWNPCGFVGNQTTYIAGPQTTDLDLTPWTDQTIKVRFNLRNFYDSHFVDSCLVFGCGCPDDNGSRMKPWPPGTWDIPTAKVYVSNLRVDTCKVDSVELQAIDSEIDTNPIAPFGKRIFTDKQSLNDSTDRSLVCVVAHTSAPNCSVTFRVLDVDDPASDQNIDPNDDGDDNDPRGVSGMTSVDACKQKLKSGADHVARTAFRASKFPGDNYVIVAGAKATDVNSVKSKAQDVTNGDGTALSPDKVQRTPLLTVWRRLHLQRDSMGIVTGNHVAGIIRTVTPAQNVPNLVQMRTNALLDLRRFEKGRIVIDGRSFVIDLNQVNSVFVTGNVADFRQFRGRPFLLYDDDDFNNNDRPNFRGDEGEDVRMPSTSLVGNSDTQEFNVLAAAYVRPVYDLSSTDGAPFELNIQDYDDLTIADLFTLDAAVQANDQDFWSFALMGAYQGTITHSRDPDDDAATLGVVDTVGGSAAVVFLETITDVKENATRNESSVVAHEIGHLFCLHHGEGGLMGNNAGGAIADIVFNPKSIGRIRRAIRWLGTCEVDLNEN